VVGRVDFRVFPTRFDLSGQRRFDFREAIGQMKELEFRDWPIKGPKTLMWLLRYMAENGGGPNAFHLRWLTEVRLDYNAAGTSEHAHLCRVLEVLISYDQVDVCRLASLELLGRKIQMVHEKWRHKLPSLSVISTDAAKKGTSMDDDSHLLLGTSETRGNVGVAPALQDWLGTELAKEALASKERRKAREERALASKGGKE
jgi:hypothetical protein